MYNSSRDSSPSNTLAGPTRVEKSRSWEFGIISVETSMASDMNMYENNEQEQEDVEMKFEEKEESNKYDTLVDESRSSSFTQCSSFQTTDEEEDMDNEMKKMVSHPSSSRKDELDSEIAFRYRMEVHRIDDVLKKDLEALKSMQQPDSVNKQLQILREELNEGEPLQESNFYMSESCLLWVITDDVNEELERQEDCLMQLMYED